MAKQKRSSAQALSKKLVRKLESMGVRPVVVRLTKTSINKDVEEFLTKLDRFQKASRKVVIIVKLMSP